MREFKVKIEAIVLLDDEECLEDLIIAKINFDKVGNEYIVAHHPSNDRDHFEVIDYQIEEDE